MIGIDSSLANSLRMTFIRWFGHSERSEAICGYQAASDIILAVTL